MNKKSALFVLIALLISCSVFFTGSTKKEYAKQVYRVYLAGETIGLIESKEKLENYIDEEQKELKEKYNVDKIYTPNDLDIVKEITYSDKISKEEDVYEIIQEKAPFTVKGYIITIKGTEEMDEEKGTVKEDDQTIYVLDKKVFESAVLRTMNAFIPTASYEAFINDTQPEIKTTGTIIEDIYIKNEITVKEGNISVEEQIFMHEEELSKYLLFGTLEEQKTYIVKEGETISEIAYNNKLSDEEFLIANPNFTSVDNLLYKGQSVSLGLIQPLIKFIEEDHVVEVETIKYDTKIEYDNSLAYGVEKVKQKGSNGTNKVTKKVQKVNGEISNAVIASTEEIKPAVDKIIVKGSKKVDVGNLGYWYWPTKKPFIITSPYGWRWGKLHEGIDISGTGHGSPIYAANNGVVVEAGYHHTNGNYVYINHNNGYYSVYAHMASLKVKKGDVVAMGEKIGTMGNTGYSFGTHLHFSIFKGYPFRGAGTVNPMRFY